MSVLPCLVCGTVLDPVAPGTDNQPYAGTVLTTEGHYGSTFFDSFDGEELEITVCDACLTARTDRLGRRKKYLPVRCAGMMGFGHEPVDRPLRPYTDPADRQERVVAVDQLGALPGIAWVPDIAAQREHLTAEQAR